MTVKNQMILEALVCGWMQSWASKSFKQSMPFRAW